MDSSTPSERRVVLAYVNADGAVAEGSNGIKNVLKVDTGNYLVNFSEPFPYLPAVCAHRVLSGDYQNTLRNCLLLYLGLDSVVVRTGNKEGQPVDSDFTFLAIGILTPTTPT